MFTTSAPDYLIRANIWSSELKQVLEDSLMAQQFVRILTDFPDGDTFNIPSIGQFQVDNYVEDTPIQYRAVDTGNSTFTFTDYMAGGYYVTDKMKQDSFYIGQVLSLMPQKMQRALMVDYETKVWKLAMNQTTSNPNQINGADHRWVASGTNETMAPVDFARALHSLTKANVPPVNLVAIVDPSVAYALNTQANLINVSNNPKWEGVITSGFADQTGTKFMFSVYNFDVYVSNYLPTANETIAATNGTRTTTAGKANLFFSATPDILPFLGAWRQQPKVESSRNKDFQRDEYVVTDRFGLKLERPENLVVVLADTDQV